MNLDFLENLEKTIKKTISKEKSQNIELVNIDNKNITQEEIELAQKLDVIEEYTIDRFEGEIVILENRKNGKMLDVKKSKIPDTALEGDILKCINGKYIIDKNETKEISDRIKDKMNDLWK